jgi:hypothetical protein
MQKTRRAFFSAILLLAIVPMSPTHAATEHGPKLVSGAPVRHTLVSCATNTGEALTCIQSVAVIEKPGDKPIVGKLTGKKIASGFDGRIGDSERPVTAPVLSATEASKLTVQVLVSNEECCHDPHTALSIEKLINGAWTTLLPNVAFYASDPKLLTSNVPSLAPATLMSLQDAQHYFPEMPSEFGMASSKIILSGDQYRFKIDGGSWKAYTKTPVTLSAVNGAPEISVTQGNYEEWTFPKADGTSASSGDLIVNSDFQPYKAIWCWTAASCSSNREEYTVYLTSSRGPNTWKGNNDVSFVVTIRAPKTFEFGEVSGSAKNTTVVYGKDLPNFKGVPMREIISTFSPIATARSNQLAGSAPEEKAYGFTYDANLNIFGMNNDITQFLGPCAKLGGIQVVSNAMHSVDPVWDPATESIKVRLETPHLAPNGDVNLGYLEIRVPRRSAICMWGLDLDGSIKASVSITYDDGSSPSVATVIGKRVENDYLIITSGFHFSSPNLAIKITQGAPAPETKVEVVAKKKMTISCAKGKTVKKITGLSPKCPKGFSLKS